MSCMNRVYLRGCEVKYLEPLLGTSDICQKPASGDRALREANLEQDDEVRPEQPSVDTVDTPPRFPASEEGRHTDHVKAIITSRTAGGIDGGKGGFSDQRPHSGVTSRNLGTPSISLGRGTEGSAGSLVIHIRSGDIFLPMNAVKMKNSFHTYGQVRSIFKAPTGKFADSTVCVTA